MSLLLALAVVVAEVGILEARTVLVLAFLARARHLLDSASYLYSLSTMILLSRHCFQPPQADQALALNSMLAVGGEESRP